MQYLQLRSDRLTDTLFWISREEEVRAQQLEHHLIEAQQSIAAF